MSGRKEIEDWVDDQDYDWDDFEDENEAYDFINNNGDWRSDLDDILKDEKPAFMEYLKGKIPEKEIEQETFEMPSFRVQEVSGYSYERNGRTVTVGSYTRKLRV